MDNATKMEQLSEIKVAFYRGNTKETVESVKSFNGNCIFLYHQIYELLENWISENMLEKFYSKICISEALSNMIIHRDYSMKGFSSISILEDRLEFLSLGGIGGNLTLPDILNGAAFCRNPEIAAEFEKEGIAKNLGHGLQVIRENRNLHEGDEADGKNHIIANPNSFLVILEKESPYRNPFNMNSEDAKTAALLFSEELPPEEKVYELIKAKKSVGRKDVEILLDCSSFPARQAIQKLLEQGRIKATGNARSTKYTLA